MKYTNKILNTLTAAITSLVLLFVLAHNTAAQGFNEQFNSPTLDPAWQVVEYTGTRVYGCLLLPITSL